MREFVANANTDNAEFLSEMRNETNWILLYIDINEPNINTNELNDTLIQKINEKYNNINVNCLFFALFFKHVTKVAYFKKEF